MQNILLLLLWWLVALETETIYFKNGYFKVFWGQLQVIALVSALKNKIITW